jgi:alkylation response protein AidB-like acyl-CoA dehydrogenase
LVRSWIWAKVWLVKLALIRRRAGSMETLEAAGGAVRRATALYDVISGEAEAGERLGRLTDVVAASLLDARLLAILNPERDGGLGGSWLDFYGAVEAIARADGSAGWCTSVCNAINHTLLLGLPAKGRDEVFGGGPASCWASLIPKAVATPEAGGFRVSCPRAGLWSPPTPAAPTRAATGRS